VHRELTRTRTDPRPRWRRFIEREQYQAALESFEQLGRRFRDNLERQREITDEDGTWICGAEAAGLLGVWEGTLRNWRTSCPMLGGSGLRTQTRKLRRQKRTYYLREQIRELAEVLAKLGTEPAPDLGLVTFARAKAELGISADLTLRRWLGAHRIVPERVALKSSKNRGRRYICKLAIPRSMLDKLLGEQRNSAVEPEGLTAARQVAARLNQRWRRITLPVLRRWCRDIFKAPARAGDYWLTQQNIADIERAFAEAKELRASGQSAGFKYRSRMARVRLLAIIAERARAALTGGASPAVGTHLEVPSVASTASSGAACTGQAARNAPPSDAQEYRPSKRGGQINYRTALVYRECATLRIDGNSLKEVRKAVGKRFPSPQYRPPKNNAEVTIFSTRYHKKKTEYDQVIKAHADRKEREDR
jgi:hypothetical protein